MKYFRKKETLVQNMAFMAIVAALNVVISLVAAFSITFSLLLIIFLPLISALTEILCKDKYYPIYALATVGLCIVSTLWNIETTLFYVVPSVLTGFVFGFVLKHKIKPIYSVAIASLIQGGLTYATIPLIKAVLQVDIINTFKVALNLTESAAFDIIVPSAIFMISVIEMTLAYVVIQAETNKFGLEINEEGQDYIISISTILTSGLIIAFYFITLKIAYLLLFISLFLMVYLIVKEFSIKAILPLILDGVSFVTSFLLYVLFNGGQMIQYSNLLLFGTMPLLVAIINLVYSLLKKPNAKE